jgi:hypothetical protein
MNKLISLLTLSLLSTCLSLARADWSYDFHDGAIFHTDKETAGK